MKLRRTLQESSRQRSAGGGAAMPLRRRPLVEAIEPRRLYSADLHPAAVVWTPQQEVRLADDIPQTAEADSTFAAREQQSTHELVIVDGRVPDLDALLDGLSQDGTREFDVIVLDTQRDGLEQITEALAGRNGLSTIHVIGHGQAGAMDLGATRLDADTLAKNADVAEAWGRALGTEGDILLYGCDVAAGDVGASFIAQLSALTHADVAASTDVTGAAAKGGNWTLEYASGRIESRSVGNTALQSAWQGTLALSADGGEVQVNTNTAGNQFTGFTSAANPSARNVAISPTGSYVVVWVDDNADGDGNAVIFQRYNASGVAQGGEFMANTATNDDQQNASVVMNDNGDFTVVWETNDGVDSIITMRRFAADGTPIDATDFSVTGVVAGVQTGPVALMDNARNVWVFWTGTDGNGKGIRANYFDESGGTGLLGPWTVNGMSADAYVSGDQYNPSVAMDDAGNIVVVWEDAGRDGSGAGIYGQVYSAPNFTPIVTNEFRINNTTANVQARPSVSMDKATGDFVVVWQSLQSGTTYDIYGQRYDVAGAAQGSQFQINTNSAGNHVNASVSMRDGGGFVVVWDSSTQDAGTTGVYMRQYNASGVAQTGEMRVNTTSTGAQQVASVAVAANDQVVVAWSGNGASDATGVFAQRYTLSANTYNTITVTSTTDVSDGDTSSISALLSSMGGDGVVSLREAIAAANNTANLGGQADHISFNIVAALVSGAHTISLTSALPDITDSVVIDGTTEPEHGSTPMVVLDGTSAGAGSDGLVLDTGSDGSTLRGLVVNNFGRSGIHIFSNGNTVAGNYIGIAADGVTAAGNSAGVSNSGDGVSIEGNNNTIGGTTAADRNVISGNDGDGVYIYLATGNVVTGNYIGLNASGTSAVGNNYSGIHITGGSSNVLGGSAAGARNVISGNDDAGISLATSDNNRIEGNYVGVAVNGNTAVGNGDSGILIVGGTGNTVGGTVAGTGNVISGNTDNGVELQATTYASVSGNRIGVNAAGTVAVGNSGGGVAVLASSSNNTIGGTSAAARNVISGNLLSGVYIDSSATNFVQGNYIGTDVTGLADLGNGDSGVEIINGATANTIGGLAANARNVIAGNTENGITIVGETSDGNLVYGNYIGVGADGSTAIANGLHGVFIDLGADNTAIGANGSGNVIAASGGSGILIDGATTGTVIRGNYIGTNAGGANLGNQDFGIDLDNGAANNTIGGTTAGDGNEIAFSGQGGGGEIWGVSVEFSAGSGNAILGNSIHHNAGLGIAIDDATTNDSGDTDTGANGLQNYPVLAAAAISGTQVRFTGSLNSQANRSYRIEFFANTTGDASGHGEGQRYLGFVNVTTDGTGDAAIDTTLTASVAVGEAVSATATDNVTNSTSQFAQNVLATNATYNEIVVTSTSDVSDGDTSSISALISNKGADGFVSLREAIIAANNTLNLVTPDRISFNIAAALVGSAHTIDLASALPSITDAVVLDATTEPEHGSTPMVVLNGASAGATVDGLTLAAGSDGSTVRGLVINGFSRDGLVISHSSDHIVAGNYIGVNAAGNAAVANGQSGISITAGDNLTIGGTAAGDRNVISGNTLYGVYQSTGANYNSYLGNYVGVGADGSTVIGNGSHGIYLLDSGYNTIGGVTAAARNVISGNGGGGIELVQSGFNTVQGNYVGVAADGVTARGNANDGIGIWNEGNNTIGGAAAGEGNVISGNAAGLHISNGHDNTALGNLIGLGADGSTSIGNTGIGVYIDGGSVDNTIGGTTAGARNVISANGSGGVVIGGVGTTGNAVRGNYIGTDVTGSLRRFNVVVGVQIEAGATGNTIGGAVAGSRNVISGNNGSGVIISGETTDGNTVSNNYIGLNAAGNGTILTDGIGIYIVNGADNTVVGSAGWGNVIVGTGQNGVRLDGVSSGTVIRGNTIGTDTATGTSNFGNGYSGVNLSNGAFNNTVGGTGVGDGNLIAFNGDNGLGYYDNGVDIGPTAGGGNAILGNRIYSNTGIGINVDANGLTANDPDDTDTGANGLQNYPVLASAVVLGAQVRMTGSINSGANTTYRIEFFASATGDATGYGGGARYLGFVNATTDGSGNASFDTTFTASVTAGEAVSSTATSLATNDTSEFSLNVAATAGTYNNVTVTSTTDVSDGDTSSISALIANMGADGFISLREAIIAANNTVNLTTPDRIVFNIPAALVGGAHTINLASALPDVTDAVVIDGTSEPDHGSTPMVVLNGASAGVGADGLRLTGASGGSTIRGLAIGGFDAGGIFIQSNNNTVAGNYIGLGADGSTVMGTSHGVFVDQGITGTVIGGTTAADRNVISGNVWGVTLWYNTADNFVQGNYIGTDATGLLDRGNASHGIWIEDAGSNTIGGTAAGAGNVISGNDEAGILINTSDNSVVQGNTIGLGADGSTSLGNTNQGIELLNGSTGNTIGGTVVGAVNVISGNGEDGILVSQSNGNTVAGNIIGLAANGTTLRGNAGNGIYVYNSTGTAIGGTTVAARNVVSGNAVNGIELEGASSNTVRGNYIGTDSTGMLDRGNSFAGVSVYAMSGGNVIGGATAGAGNVISGNNEGVDIQGNSSGNTVAGNTIGLASDGSTALGNDTNGVQVQAFSLNNVIGGTTVAARNVISGNGLVGVALLDTNDNFVQGNYIGLAADGSTIRGNNAAGTGAGVYILSGGASSTNNVIGGTAAGAGNVISGNDIGVHIDGVNSTGNLVQGNYIGTDATGLLARGNSLQGIFINQGANANMIGGGTSSARNVISGNGGAGIEITDDTSDSNVVENNYIGLAANGTAALGNGSAGILVGAADNTIIGAANAGNVIGGNASRGIEITGSATGTVVQGNYIGTNAGGANLGNSGGAGVLVTNTASNSLIGGTGVGEGNAIAFNSTTGVAIDSTAGAANRILSNSIHSNGGLGIDLGNNGVTANDAGDADAGANALQNYPVLASALVLGAQVRFTGSLNSSANTSYRIEFFSNATGDASGYGEGRRFLGGINVTTDGSGNASFDSTLNAAVTAGDAVSTTATNLSTNDTSEFSQNVAATTGAYNSIVVNSTTDVADGDTSSINALLANMGADGFISLREAIIAANNTTNLTAPDRIVFNIPAALTGGAHTISLTSALPVIIDAVVIDGTSEPDFGGTPMVVLDGTSAGFGAIGVHVYTGGAGSTIRGLSVVNFSSSGIMLNATNNVTVAGNYVGLRADGITAGGNGYGIRLEGYSASNLIGGTTAGAGNVIASNTSYGVSMDAGSNVVQGNLIGLAADGTTVRGNGAAGVLIQGVFAVDNIIGGTTAAARNVISGNSSFGVAISSAGTGNIVQGNYIGTDITGLLDRGNADAGVYVGATDGATVGGTAAGAGNVVSGNDSDGIELDNASNVQIQGNLVGLGANGSTLLGNTSGGIWLHNTASNNTIGGTTAGARNVISGNSYGVSIDDTGADDNVVQGNYIGTDATGLLDRGNTSEGVTVRNGATGNYVGGAIAGAGNVISGNAGSGVRFYSASTNFVQGNLIGLGADGSTSLGNAGYGVLLEQATYSGVGGPTGLARNVISANGGSGVDIFGGGGNTVTGNYIGTDATGLLARGNGDGVSVRGATSGDVIGGVTTNLRNVISGNALDGVHLIGETVDGVSILNNYIGVGADGSTALGNGHNGVLIDGGGDGNSIGAAGAGNVIAASGWNGVAVAGAVSDTTMIRGNFIGTNAGGANLGNVLAGISLADGALLSIIGGTTAGEGNTIAFNATGVELNSTAGVANRILGNSIHSNTGRGIDLGVNGITANDAGDADTGANSLQNFPVLASVVALGAQVRVTGSLNSSANTTYRIELFANVAGDPSGYGEGQRYLGFVNVTTDGSGNASFDTTLSASVVAGEMVSATATNLTANDTSEFAQNVVATTGAYNSIVVTSTTDVADGDTSSINALISNMGADGFISLREAIIAANNTINLTAPDRIVFNIPAALIGGAHTISLASALPTITDAVVIDGSSEPDFGSAPMVVLDGTSAGASVNGLTLGAGSSGSTIRGLVIHSFSFNGIQIDSSNSHVIAGNYLGVGADGLTARGNASAGVYLYNSTGTTVGGSTAADRNLISSNGSNGVVLENSSSNTVSGNYIGVAADGTTARGNTTVNASASGVFIWGGSSGNTIGGTVAGSGNVISGNQAGVRIDGSSTNTVAGNLIGLAADGMTAVGNLGAGVHLTLTASDNTIGGNTTAARNVISGNGLFGVLIQDSSNNFVQGNYIGLAADGSTIRGNNTIDPNGAGVYVLSGSGGATNNLIGGSIAGSSNVISGNGTGVRLDSFNTSGNQVLGNYIGTDATGLLARGNTSSGVALVSGTVNNTITSNVISGNGGDGIFTDGNISGTVIQRNLIGVGIDTNTQIANAGAGVHLFNGAQNTLIGGAGVGNVIGASGSDGISINSASGTVIRGNYIGTNASGANLGNQYSGIVIGSAGGTNNIVGGTGAGESNEIAFNGAGGGSAGVAITSTGGGGNAILGNRIHDNAGVGIDLNNDGVTANDAGDADSGANALQNHPVLTAASSTGAQTHLAGWLNSGANTSYRIEFFANTAADAGGYGEGQRYLGFVNVTTDGAGNASFDTTLLSATTAGEAISATATNLSTNDTSEFAANVVVVANAPPAIYNFLPGDGASSNVTVAEDTTYVKRFWATDADAPAQTLTFSIAGADAGLFTIDATTGVLRFVSPHSAASPNDANSDGVYNLTVTVSDGVGGSASQLVNVTVTGLMQKVGGETPVAVNPTDTVFTDMWTNAVSRSVGMDAAGNIVVVWDADLNDGNGRQVFMQRFDAQGAAMGGLVHVNGPGAVTSDSAQVTVGRDGSIVVVWETAGPDIDVHAQRFDANGVPLGGEFLVSTTVAANQTKPSAAMGSNGSFVIVWTSDDGNGTGIYAQRFDASGAAQGGEFLVNTTTASVQSDPVVAMADNGSFVVVWDSLFQDGSGYGIYGQRFNAAGAAQGGEFQISTTTYLDQSVPAIAMNGAGDFVVVWSGVYARNTQATDPGDQVYQTTYAQRFNAAGAAQGGEIVVGTGFDFVQFPPSVAMQSNGGFVVAWNSTGFNPGVDNPIDGADGSGAGVYVRQFGANGVAVTGETRVNTTAAGDQSNASVAIDDNGHMVVMWKGNGAADADSVFFQRFVAPVLNSAPVITSDGGGATASLLVNEGTTSVTTVVATDADVPAQGLTYTITGGADAAFFTINSTTGALSFITPQVYGVQNDADTNGNYRVTVTVSDGQGGSDVQDLLVTLVNVNDAPVITSNGGGTTANISVAENGTAVTTVTATDVDAGTTLAYAINGGTDAVRFTIDATTGVLSFITAPDFEAPTDANTDGIYQVSVTVSDGNGGSASQLINVTVTDANDAPVITSHGGAASASLTVAPRATVATTVTATDADTPAQPLSYSIAGGADASMFTVNPTSGTLIFVFPQDGNTPADANGDGIYQVTVLVSDGNGGTRAQALSIRVQASGAPVTPIIPAGGSGSTAPVEAATPSLPDGGGGGEDTGNGIKLPTGPQAGSDAGGANGSSSESELLGGSDSLSAGIAAGTGGPSSGNASALAVGTSGSSSTAAGIRYASGLLNDRPDAQIELLFNEVKLVAAEQLPLINSFASPSYSSGARHGNEWRPLKDDSSTDEDAVEDSPAGGLSLMHVGGIAAALGTAWWAMRASGILVSLLASTPTWRNFDPLPVLGDNDEDAGDDENDPRLDDRGDPERRRDEAAVGELLDASEEH